VFGVLFLIVAGVHRMISASWLDEVLSTRCGGQGVTIFYGMAKPVRAPQIGPAHGDHRMSHPSAPSELEKRSAVSTRLKFSVSRLALAFFIAGVSDVIGAFASLAPPIGWAVDIVTATLLFVVLGWQWLLLLLVLEAMPGLGIAPFWLLVVAAIAVFGTPRPKIGQR
jgi:hypothetical protein